MNRNPASTGDVKLPHQPGTPFAAPTPLTKGGIEDITNQFVYTAETAYHAGYDGVQTHAAHGYLIAQFLSRATNNRDDEYGGLVQNRARIIREIIEGIRATTHDKSFVLGIKTNSAEFQAEGFQPEEAAEPCQEIENLQSDFVELIISGGTYEDMRFHHGESCSRASTKKRETFFLEKIVPSLSKTLPFLTGGFRTAAGMADAIRSGVCAGVGIGHPATSDPYLPAEIMGGEVGGVTVNKFPPRNLWVQILASGVQMDSIARSQPVFDVSDPKDVKRRKKRECESRGQAFFVITVP